MRFNNKRKRTECKWCLDQFVGKFLMIQWWEKLAKNGKNPPWNMKDVTTINRYDLLSDVRNSTSYFPYFVDDLWLSLMCSNGPFSYHNHVYCSIIKIVCQQKNHLWTGWETVSLIKKFCEERSQKREKKGKFYTALGYGGLPPLWSPNLWSKKENFYFLYFN